MRTLTVALVLCSRSGVAYSAWMVDANDTCVEQWAASDLLRGPRAIACAPLRPVRTMAGGAEYAWNKSEWWPWYTVMMGAAVVGVSAAAGLVEGLWWMCTGVGDTVTGGYFELTPDTGLECTVQPAVSIVISDSAPAPTEDRCGRPLAAGK